MALRSFVVLTSVVALLVGCSSSHLAEGDDGGIVVDMVDSGTDGGPGTPAADAGSTTSDDAGQPIEADAGGGTTTSDAGPLTGGPVECMGMTCDGTSERCCITGDRTGASAMCIPIDEPCMGAEIVCDGPDDCGDGEVCCGRASLAGVNVACEPAADGCGSSFGDFEICATVDDCSNPGDMCCPLMMRGFSSAFCSPRCF